jgi:hypothetical protein
MLACLPNQKGKSPHSVHPKDIQNVGDKRKSHATLAIQFPAFAGLEGIVLPVIHSPTILKFPLFS